MEHSGNARGDGFESKRLGHWLRALHGRVYGTLRIDLVAHPGAANKYVLTEVDGERPGD